MKKLFLLLVFLMAISFVSATTIIRDDYISQNNNIFNISGIFGGYDVWSGTRNLTAELDALNTNTLGAITNGTQANLTSLILTNRFDPNQYFNVFDTLYVTTSEFRVGIGTSDPQYTLDVQGTLYALNKIVGASNLELAGTARVNKLNSTTDVFAAGYINITRQLSLINASLSNAGNSSWNESMARNIFGGIWQNTNVAYINNSNIFTQDQMIRSLDDDNNTVLTIASGSTLLANFNASLKFMEYNLDRWSIFFDGLDNNLYIRDDLGDGINPTNFLKFGIAEDTIISYVPINFSSGKYPTSDLYCDTHSCYNLTNMTFGAGEYVPYSGADDHVDLGLYNISASNVQADNEVYSAFLCDNFGVGCIDMRSDPWSLNIGLQIGKDLTVEGRNITRELDEINDTGYQRIALLNNSGFITGYSYGLSTNASGFITASSVPSYVNTNVAYTNNSQTFSLQQVFTLAPKLSNITGCQYIAADASGNLLCNSSAVATSTSYSNTNLAYLNNTQTFTAANTFSKDILVESRNITAELDEINDTGYMKNDSDIRVSALEVTKGNGDFEVNLSGILYINSSSGRVGIGTPTPTNIVQVVGLSQFSANSAYTAGNAIEIGNDAYLADLDTANTIGLYGVNDATVGGFKLGSSGSTLYGKGGMLGINELNPTFNLSLKGNANITLDLYVEGRNITAALDNLNAVTNTNIAYINNSNTWTLAQIFNKDISVEGRNLTSELDILNSNSSGFITKYDYGLSTNASGFITAASVPSYSNTNIAYYNNTINWTLQQTFGTAPQLSNITGCQYLGTDADGNILCNSSAVATSTSYSNTNIAYTNNSQTFTLAQTFSKDISVEGRNITRELDVLNGNYSGFLIGTSYGLSTNASGFLVPTSYGLSTNASGFLIKTDYGLSTNSSGFLIGTSYGLSTNASGFLTGSSYGLSTNASGFITSASVPSYVNTNVAYYNNTQTWTLAQTFSKDISVEGRNLTAELDNLNAITNTNIAYKNNSNTWTLAQIFNVDISVEGRNLTSELDILRAVTNTNIAYLNNTQTFTANNTFNEDIIQAQNKKHYMGTSYSYYNGSCIITQIPGGSTFEQC